MSWANRARVRCPRCRAAVPGPSRLGPKALGVDQLSRATPAQLQKSCGVDQLSQAIPAQLGGPAVSTSSSGPLVLWSEGPRGRPAVQGDSGPGPKAGGVNQLSLAPRVLFRGLGVNQLSRMSWAFFRGPKESTSCPWRLGPESKGPWCQPSVPGDSHSSPWIRGVEQLSRVTGARFQCPQVRPGVPGNSGRVRGPAVAISCLAQLGSGAEVPLCRPAVPHDLGLFSRAQGVNQLSLVTHTPVRGPAVSNNCPGRLGPWSEGPRVRPALPGASHSGRIARGFDQVSRGKRARV